MVSMNIESRFVHGVMVDAMIVALYLRYSLYFLDEHLECVFLVVAIFLERV